MVRRPAVDVGEGTVPQYTRSETQDIPTFVQTVKEDLEELNQFHNISISLQRVACLREYLKAQLHKVDEVRFDDLDQNGKIDLILLKNFLEGSLQQLALDERRDGKVLDFIGPFVNTIIRLCEARQSVSDISFEQAAKDLTKSNTIANKLVQALGERDLRHEISKQTGYRAAYKLEELGAHLAEWHKFYSGYDPMFDWWMTKPYLETQEILEQLIPLIREKIVGVDATVKDPIVGEPIGREGILANLDYEKIAYSPEELIEIAHQEYKWCIKEAEDAAGRLGFGQDWKAGLEHVKEMYVGPGQQTCAIRDLAQEATQYVQNNDLITVPEVAKSWRMYMISPESQKTNPFFLGGPYMQVSYPTDEMSTADKLMSMRGNAIPLSRSTVFHELIPGHHLQYHMIKRYRPYRRLFDTPFWMEGWALYWEYVLWDKGFVSKPEDRIGMMFWRIHRCLRIIFSLKFHLGEWTPQQCIDVLVEKGGHERATAEGEVRRSFNGDYRPLYQAGYMLGALQLLALRKEVLSNGKMTEKAFHDRVLQENEMPIEILRALILDQKVNLDFKSSWRFHHEHQHDQRSM